MNGVHDMAGVHGFGPVPVEEGETFHEAWEKRLFGLRAVMNFRRVPGSLDEHRYAIELLPPEVYVAAQPFERWLLGGENVYVEHGVLTRDEIERRRAELASAPETALPSNHDPAFLEQVLAGMRFRRRPRPELDVEPRFAVGDVVVTRTVHPVEHTRLPRYLRGKRGVVDRLYGGFDLPELAARGEHRPEHLYEVRFEGRDVWGEASEPNTCHYAQLWESYLEPPAA